MITIACANALNIPLADKSVQCVVTSPPYWGLRDYGIADQIGLESTPAAYVVHIVAVMRECWRVLKDDGVLWLNLGDSYARNGGEPGGVNRELMHLEGNQKRMLSIPDGSGLKPKDLCGIPWRVAFALQEDGWYLRSDIIWEKPNPMPESVTDRPTKAHEYVFLLTKQARYYYDAAAIYEQATQIERRPSFRGGAYVGNGAFDNSGNGGKSTDTVNIYSDITTRNRRSVWTVATQPYSGAHFATFPPALIEPMILAGTSARGECPHCGKAWVRVVERTRENGLSEDAFPKSDGAESTARLHRRLKAARDNGEPHDNALGGNITLGWRQQCDCRDLAVCTGDHSHDCLLCNNAGFVPMIPEPIPQTVLDPFAGSGTTGAVAIKHGRKAVLLDLNTKYIDLQFERTNGIQITMQV